MREIKNLMNRIALTIVLGGCLAIAGNAATFIVNSSADDQNDGCGIAANGCTLREAVGAANAANDADTITIDAGITTITLLTGEIAVNTGAVTITPSVVNAPVTIDGAANGRIFNVFANTTLNRLLLTNAASSADGGAIINNGAVLTVNDSYLTNNTANGNGGGIYTNGGTVNFNRSTIGGTVTPAPATGNGAANGGGIYNLNGTVVLSNSTISGNRSGNIGGGYYGFASLGAASLSSTISTVAFNTATNGGGIAVSSTLGFTSTASINNTIVSNNTAMTSNDLNGNPLITGLPGTITSGGYNIIRNTTGATVVAITGDQFNVDPLILPLGANGGLTPTHGLRLSPVSPAIDKGNTALTVDQRGLTRPVDLPPVNAVNGSDIGAFEAQFGTTAAEVIVGGRVIGISGRGISGATVRITGTNGATQRTRTNPFGFYRFLKVPSGATYVISASLRNRTTNPRVISVIQDTTDVDLQEEPRVPN